MTRSRLLGAYRPHTKTKMCVRTQKGLDPQGKVKPLFAPPLTIYAKTLKSCCNVLCPVCIFSNYL